MQITTTDGKTFTLRRETDADKQLLESLDLANQAHVIDVLRTTSNGSAFITEAVVIEVSRHGEHALKAQSGRQALSALGQLVSLGLREAAHHGHVSATPTHPQAQEQLTALLVQIQMVLESLRNIVSKQELMLQKMNCPHNTPTVVETAIVVEGGAV